MTSWLCVQHRDIDDIWPGQDRLGFFHALGKAAGEVVEDGGQFLGIHQLGPIRRKAVTPEADDMGDGAHLLAQLQEHVRRAEQEVAEGLGRLVGHQLLEGIVVDRQHLVDVLCSKESRAS